MTTEFQFPVSPKRFAAESESVYNSELRAVNRKGLTGVYNPAESDRLEPREVPVEVVGNVDESADPIVMMLDEYDAERAESAKAYAAARAVEAEAEREKRVAAVLGDVAASADVAPLTADDFELDDAQPAAAANTAANAIVSSAQVPTKVPGSSKRAITLQKPQYRKALRAASRYQRRRVLRRGALRVVGVVAIVLAVLLAVGCSGPEKTNDLIIGYLPAGPAVVDSGGAAGDSSAAPSAVPATIDIIAPNENFGSAEPPREAAPQAAPVPANVSGARTHIVQPGDTLYSIARQHYGDGSKWRDVAAANGIADASAMSVGMELQLPGLGGDSGAAMSPASSTQVAPANPPAAAGNVITDAEQLIAAGKLGDARRNLSAALYSLAPADEARAVNLLHDMSRQLLGDTGADGDCRVHVVARGENLYRIAMQYDVPWQSIRKLNQLKSTAISVGQQLRVLKGEPKLIVLRGKGVADLWLGDHFVKRYAVRIGQVPAPVVAAQTTIADKKDAPANTYGSRVMALANGETLHGTPNGPGGRAERMMFANADIEELFDILRKGSAVEIR